MSALALSARQDILQARNIGWRRNPAIPTWVKPETVDLDRFFTRPEVAADCHRHLLEYMGKEHANETTFAIIAHMTLCCASVSRQTKYSWLAGRNQTLQRARREG